MIEPVGKKLQEARSQKNLTIDDVARATKMRPERIVEIENDDYGNFPNLAYARSFLLLYARHLGIELRDVSSSCERQNQFGFDDYEYLSNTPQPRAPVTVENPSRSMLPFLIVFIVLIVAGIVCYIIVSFQRLGDLDQLAEKQSEASHPAAVVATPAVSASPTPTPTPVARVETPAPAPVVASVKLKPSPTPPAASPAPAIAAVEVRRAVPVQAPVTPPPGNEIILKPLKKTWVKVRQGDANSPVVFEDFLYPDGRPLTLKGEHFFIQADSNGENLKITKNGEAVAYTAPGISVE